MEIKEIAGGTITIEMEHREALALAVACHAAEIAAYTGEAEMRVPASDMERYAAYRALFEAMACAGNAQDSIEDSAVRAECALSAQREAKRA